MSLSFVVEVLRVEQNLVISNSGFSSEQTNMQNVKAP